MADQSSEIIVTPPDVEDLYIEYKKDITNKPFDLPEGKYVLNCAIPLMIPGERFNYVEPKLIIIQSWSGEDGRIDPITRRELTKDQKVAVMGQNGCTVAMNTLNELLEHRSNEVILPTFS